MDFQPWEKEMVALTIIYRITECHDQIPMICEGTKWSTIGPILQDLFNQDFLAPTDDNLNWTVTSKGQELRKRTLGMIDVSMRFEIFTSYNFDLDIDEGLYKEDSNELHDDVWDPRFDETLEGNKEDLRIPMMVWMAEKLRRGGKVEGALDPLRVIYLRHLANGLFSGDSGEFFKESNLKRVFQEIRGIEESAYVWTALGENDEDSFDLGQILYTAGMLQLKKEQGPSCSKCDSPLALFGVVDTCPVCNADYNPPAEEGDDAECPNCGSGVKSEQSRCLGCGADLVYNLPAGTVAEESETVVVTEEQDYYDCGYQPYGWYDPYDPYMDAVAFGVVCGAILLF